MLNLFLREPLGHHRSEGREKKARGTGHVTDTPGNVFSCGFATTANLG